MQLCQLDSLTVFQLQFSCNILALQTERDVDVLPLSTKECNSRFLRSQTICTLTEFIKKVLTFMIQNKYHYISYYRIYFHNKFI
jgi:hypothetical protein